MTQGSRFGWLLQLALLKLAPHSHVNHQRLHEPDYCLRSMILGYFTELANKAGSSACLTCILHPPAAFSTNACFSPIIACAVYRLARYGGVVEHKTITVCAAIAFVQSSLTIYFYQ